MKKDFLKQQKEKLEAEKKKIEERLQSFAKQNKDVKGDWKTVYPEFNSGHLEEEADEVEEYANLLSVEHVLEKELKKINNGLERIKKGDYGLCQKCGKPISQERLKVYPQAELCKKCQ